MGRLSSECIAVAKRDLTAGQTLGGIGEFDYRVSIDTAEVAKAERLLPAGLAQGCVLKEDVAVDTVLTWDMIAEPNDSALLDLRRLQDRLYA
jgi:predicted homoserine dehydrogenase-like protein